MWWDANGNGIYNAGEAGQAGITVRLLTADGLTVLDTTTTAGDGTYSFAVAPGSYQIETDLTTAPAEYRFSPQNQGSDDTIDSDADPATGRIPVTVTNGTDNLTYDTGMFKPPALGDVVWVDVDGDGIQDAGEPGLAGVTVTLFDDLDVQVGSMVTAADGSYGFSGLALGDYYVVFDLATVPGGGYLFTTPNVGADDTVDSDADPITGRSQTVTLAVGETQTTLDAGAYLPVTIGDIVYERPQRQRHPRRQRTRHRWSHRRPVERHRHHHPRHHHHRRRRSLHVHHRPRQLPDRRRSKAPSGLTTPVQTQGTNPQTLTLTSGQTNTGIDYGYYQPATLGDRSGWMLMRTGSKMAANRERPGSRSTCSTRPGSPFWIPPSPPGTVPTVSRVWSPATMWSSS